MSEEISEHSRLACEGSAAPLTDSPVVGTPEQSHGTAFVPGTEELAAGEVRVTILGSGDPFVRPSQSSGSVLVEVGNEERDLGEAWREMRAQYDGLVTIAQDLTVFNLTQESVLTRQAIPDPMPWPVLGPTQVTGPPMAEPPAPPAWWADALLTD